MDDSEEVERIRGVYLRYQQDDAKWAQWSSSLPGNQALEQERARLIHEALERAGRLPLTGASVLDVGCGNGNELARMEQWGASPGDLHGVDLLPDVVQEARDEHPELDIAIGNAEQLDFVDASFDLVLLYTVMSSVLDDAMARNISAEVQRVLKPDGSIVWYDLRCPNPRNHHVRALRRGAIATLFPDFEQQLRPATVLPPLARRLGRYTPTIYPQLARIPVLQSHYIGLLNRGRGSRRGD